MKFKPSHLAICLELESKGLLGWQWHGINYWLIWPWPWPSILHFSTNKNHKSEPHFYLRVTGAMASTKIPFRAPSWPTVENPMWLKETLIFIDFLESGERCREMHAAPPRPSPIPPWASIYFKCTKQGEAGGKLSIFNTKNTMPRRKDSIWPPSQEMGPGKLLLTEARGRTFSGSVSPVTTEESLCKLSNWWSTL